MFSCNNLIDSVGLPLKLALLYDPENPDINLHLVSVIGTAKFLDGDKKGGCDDLRSAADMGHESARIMVEQSCIDY